MAKYEVAILPPGVVNIGDGEQGDQCQFAAEVYITRSVRIGPELGRFIGGAVGRITISEVVSTDKGTHATVACAQGRSTTPDVVEQAVDRMSLYFNTKPAELGMLGQSFSQAPLVAGYSFQQM